ncbi:hypothetical protein [Streptomyces sp. NPDC002785]
MTNARSRRPRARPGAAAGLVGGALLNEAFSDDEPDVIVNNYYEED